jgi:hypothetical protein
MVDNLSTPNMEIGMRTKWFIPFILLLILTLTACARSEPEAAVATATPVAEAPAEETVVEPTPAETPAATPEPALEATPEATPEPAEAADVETTPAAPAQTTPAAEPAAAATPCPEALSGQDALVAEEYPVAGCPEGPAERVYMARQSFQHGQMIWREDTQTIYVMYNDGSWLNYEDTFEEGQPESDPALTPPQNLLQPVRGFGQVWREELGGPAATIGWATSPEAGVNATIQPWENGDLLVFDLANRFLLLDNGRWEQVQ